MKLKFTKKAKAYNLQELLIVLVIIGILVLIALPNLLPLIANTRSIEAKNQLDHLHSLEKTHFAMYGKYSNDFNKIGFIPPKSLSNGGTAYYNYEIIEASNTSFKARAIGAQDFDSDGMVSIWEIDQEKNLVEVQRE